MTNNTNEPTFITKSIPDFLTPSQINQLLDSYQRIQKQVIKEYGRYKLTEVFLPLRRCPEHLKILFEDNIGGHVDTRIKTPSNLKKYIGKLRRHIIREFETESKKLQLRRLCIHNLDSPLNIHCDGNDVTNRYDARPNNLSQFTVRHHPDSSHEVYNQGLITLKNDNKYNGTVVFNQWFPVSTYILNNTEFDQNYNKTLIKFYKGEKWERFGEKIRHATGKELRADDWWYLCRSSENPNLLERSDFFGLSVDRILHFKGPGTCSVWPNKRYHASLVTNQWSANRINLQFETILA